MVHLSSCVLLCPSPRVVPPRRVPQHRGNQRRAGHADRDVQGAVRDSPGAGVPAWGPPSAQDGRQPQAGGGRGGGEEDGATLPAGEGPGRVEGQPEGHAGPHPAPQRLLRIQHPVQDKVSPPAEEGQHAAEAGEGAADEAWRGDVRLPVHGGQLQRRRPDQEVQHCGPLRQQVGAQGAGECPPHTRTCEHERACVCLRAFPPRRRATSPSSWSTRTTPASAVLCAPSHWCAWTAVGTRCVPPAAWWPGTPTRR